MREKFYNTTGFNTAKIVVNCLAGDVEFYYHLNDNPVQHIWQEIHKNTKSFSMGVSHNIEQSIALEKLNVLCERVGESKIAKVTQESLNKLHNKFVSKDATQDWLDINFYIHALENTLNNEFAEYDSSIVFYQQPAPAPIKIKEEHKLWLTTENRWGRLLLGYETIGKDWIDIAHNNDDLLDLSIKQYIGSETLMVFNAEQPFTYGDKIDFYRWAKQSTYNIPLDNLNELALGRYMLGELIITDNFLDFNSNASDWYVPNHKCRLRWNKEVIGTSPVVKSINFFNSDMNLETLLRHTNA